MPRLPRFKRASNIPACKLTPRDCNVILLIHRHRFLRSSHIRALTGGSPQQLLRRLQLLYHHGYLERPRAQLEYYGTGGSRPMVYGLGNRSAQLLQHEFGISALPSRQSEKNGSVRRIYLAHALLVSDVMVAVELACRRNGIRFCDGPELPLPESLKQESHPFRWDVKAFGRVKLGVVPDRAFALDFGGGRRSLFFLEADRGTMPVMRKNLSQTSFFRKLLAYEATWLQSIHEKRFGFHRFRVMTVTTSAERVKSLVDACSQLKRGRGLFLFADRTILDKDMFAPIWQAGRPGETGSLLD